MRMSFIFTSLILGNLFYIYLNVAFILSVSFTNSFFIWSNLMWRGGNIFFDSTSGECWTFFLPDSWDCRKGQFLLIQWELLSRLTHSKRNQQYLVYSLCSPSKRVTNFKSLQSCQLELIYLSSCFILSQVFLCELHDQMILKVKHYLCLTRRISDFVFEESINSLHSSRL